MLSLAAGALLATAFMHLLPEAFESQAGAKELFALLLAGGLSYLGYVWYQSHLDGKNKEAAALLAQMVDKAQTSTDPKALNADLQHFLYVICCHFLSFNQ